MATYRYRDLTKGEIRLAHVRNSFPGPDGFKPAVTIIHCQLDAAKDTYRALSYVWGSEKTPRRVDCGNGEHIPAGESLWAVLVAILKRQKTEVSEPRYFWIDAICINQLNDEERNAQVQMMRDIYQGAKIVIGYLGESADNSDLVVNYFTWSSLKILRKNNEKLAQVDLEAQARKRYAKLKYVEPEMIEQYVSLEKSKINLRVLDELGASPEELFGPYQHQQTQVLKAIASLLARPFFRRIWIIQENTVCAAGVIFWIGVNQIYFRSFSILHAFRTLGIDWASVVDEKVHADFYSGISQYMAINTLRVRMSDDSHRDRLFLLLQRFRTSRATLPVDKVYALVGLSKDEFPINYLKSKAEVYLQLAQAFVHYYDAGSQMLYEAARSDERSPDLPSWVVDWEKTPTRINLGQTISGTSKWFFDASGSQMRMDRAGYKYGAFKKNLYKTMSITCDNEYLTAQGAIVQRLIIVGAAAPTQPSAAANATHLANVIEDATTYLDRLENWPSVLGSDIEGTLAKALEADQTRTSLSSNWSEETTSKEVLYTVDFDKLISSVKSDRYSFSRMSYLQDKKTLHHMVRTSVGRSFAVTSGGCPAMAPSRAKPGDVIAILWASMVPFVLRPVGNDYILIGDCYVSGMMHGEVFEDEKRAPAMREIRIR